MARISQAITALSTFLTIFSFTVFLAQTTAAQDYPFAPDLALYGADVIINASLISDNVPSSEGKFSVNSVLGINGTDTENEVDASFYAVDRRAAAEFYLRIMPLGASITQGYASSDGNGYRKWLRSRLRYAGWKVNMVGSQQTGTMADKDNEGHPGWVISTVHDAFAQSKAMKPNLVLINVGANDCGGNIDISNGGTRMKALVDDIYASIPGTTVIISSLPPSGNTPACAIDLSNQYRNLYQSYKNAGARVGFADMQTALVIADIRGDGTHPTDDGYKKMASVWWDAFQKIQGGLQAPDANAMNDALQTTAATCAKVAGNAPPAVQMQQGSGADDGNYVHHSIGHGVVQSFGKGTNSRIAAATPSHMFVAQIVSKGNPDRSARLDEFIRITHEDSGLNTYFYRLNNGGGNFDAPVTFTVGMDCNAGPTYFFADFNGDGLDDFYCIGVNAEIRVSLNRGGQPPVFESIGQVMGANAGYNQADVRIADIDGDGRADYCVIATNGAILCSRNGGVGDAYFWQGFSTPGGLLGQVFPGQGMPDKSGVFLGDLNGDFRADYMYINDKGSVDTWINFRSWTSGMAPYWLSAGRTHGGQAITGVQDQIKFGNIYGSGRLDYIYLVEDPNWWNATIYENTGGGGTRVKGDGTFYCDMRGTGSDDYVWIYNDGQTAQIFENIHSPPAWGQNSQNLFSVPGPRVGIHLADWDGDGKCDVLTQDKATGALHMWKNNYNALTDKFNFVDMGIVSGGAKCTQGWGVGIFDRGLRLHDIDGDGRADYLCIEPDGRVTGWLNPITGLKNVGQIKLPAGFDRANIRFADVEKSGRADLIWVDKYTGAATVVKNKGPTPVSGSSFTWELRGVLYSPVDRGANIHFANIGGLGRADMIDVWPLSNRAWVYYNTCGTSSGGDDGAVADPGLPAYTSPADPGTGTGGGGTPTTVALPPTKTPTATPTVTPDNSCKLKDRTFSATPITGEYMPWFYMEPEDAADGGPSYITIVNLTPHKFTLNTAKTHSYQFDTFDFGDVPPGRSRQNKLQYTNKVKANSVDDNGEAYYSIDGTSKTFTVRATTHIPDTWPWRTVFDLTGMGLGQREYRNPEQAVPVTLVITGSIDYGFITNIVWSSKANWMFQMKSVIHDRPIKHIVFPGTHDSGMTSIGSVTNGFNVVGDSGTTQTQGINFYDQLRAGSRWFDLRILSVHQVTDLSDYDFRAAHVSDENLQVPAGASGEKLSDIIKEVNQFLAENPGEVMFFRLRYLTGIRNVPSLGPIKWTNAIMTNFINQLKLINNRCPNIDTSTDQIKFTSRTAGFFMDKNNNNGCVIFLVNADNLPKPGTTIRDSISDGIYPNDAMGLVWDDWSQRGDTVDMANKEVSDWRSVSRPSGETNIDQLFISQWMVSADTLTLLHFGVQAMGILPTNPSLYWAGLNGIDPEHFPNGIQVDYLGLTLMNQNDWDDLSADLVTFSIGLNLYMISENCNISPGRSPLLAPISKRDLVTTGTSLHSNPKRGYTRGHGKLANPEFKGIKFSNGTRIDVVPANFHYQRVNTLKAGTVFGNGTVLTVNKPNPDYNTAY